MSETTDTLETLTTAEESAERARQAAQGRSQEAQAALAEAAGRIAAADEVIAEVTARIATSDPDDDATLGDLAGERGRAQAKREALATQLAAREQAAAERRAELATATLAADEARRARLVAQAQAAAAVLDEFTGEAFERIGADLHAVQALLFAAHRLAKDIAQRQGRRGPDVLATHGTGIGIGAADKIEARLSKALAKRRT